MSSRLEELKRKRQELADKANNQRKLIAEDAERQTKGRSATPDRLLSVPTPSDKKPEPKAGAKFPLKSSAELVLLSHKQEERKIFLEEGIMVNFELDNQRLKAEEDNVSDNSEEEPEVKEETRFLDKLDELRKMNQATKGAKKLDQLNFRQLQNEEVEQLFTSKEQSALAFFRKTERLLNEELDQQGKEELIEDYIFNQDKDVREQKEGCIVKKIEDPEVEGKYMVNDLVWMKSNLYETEKIAVCFSKLTGIRETLFDKHDYFVGVYSNEKRVETKSSRTEIKKICADDQDDTKILGGLDNGRIAVWDLRTEKAGPDQVSKISEKANYLPIIDIKKRQEEVFTIGLEGRICKWDARKFEEPLFYFDLLCLPEGNSIAQLEAMPMSMEMDPVDKEVIYVTTFEGSVYELLVNPNNFQQRNFLPDVHVAPITRLKVMDFKSFFKDQVNVRRSVQFPATNAKFVNHLLTASFDWGIKLFKGSLANEIHTFKYHNDFVTNIDVNNALCPFTFASADAEGKLAVWKLDSNNLDMPIFEWSNPHSISRISWNFSGMKLAVGDVRGVVNTLTFPKAKLLIPEKTVMNYMSSGLVNLKKN